MLTYCASNTYLHPWNRAINQCSPLSVDVGCCTSISGFFKLGLVALHLGYISLPQNRQEWVSWFLLCSSPPGIIDWPYVSQRAWNLRLYDTSMSNPIPKNWNCRCNNFISIASTDDVKLFHVIRTMYRQKCNLHLNTRSHNPPLFRGIHAGSVVNKF